MTQFCALGGITRLQVGREEDGLAPKRTSGGCADGLHIETMLISTQARQSMNKIIRGQYLVSLILKYGVRGLGLILIGLCMFGGGIGHTN